MIVYIWIAITAIMITGTLFWNLFLANRKIEIEVEKSFKRLNESIISNFIEVEAKYETRLSKIKDELLDVLNTDSENRSNKLNDQLQEFTKANERHFDQIWGDIHRSFSSAAIANKHYSSVIERSLFAITYYDKLGGNGNVIASLIENIEIVLKKPETIELIKNDDDFMTDTWISIAEKFIPDSTGKTKKLIINKLKECKK